MLATLLSGVHISQSVAQSPPPTGGGLPVVSIFRSGSHIITEGEDAVFVLTAEPAPATDLTINMERSQYRIPLAPGPIDEGLISRDMQQTTIGVSGEAVFIVPAEDDSENEPLMEFTVRIEPGDGYELNRACTPEGRCTFPLNVYADEQIWTNPEFATLSVRDNDGPQAMNSAIAAATMALLDQVGTLVPAAADVRDLAALVEDSTAAADDMIDGGTTQNEALLLLRSSRTQIEISERLTVAGFAVMAEDVNAIVRNAAAAISLHYRYKPSAQRFEINTGPPMELEIEIRDFLASSRNLIQPWAAAREEHAAIGVVRGLLDEIGALVRAGYGSFLNETEIEDTASISQTALEILLRPVAVDLGLAITFSDEAAMESLLQANPRLLRKLVDAVGLDLTTTQISKEYSGRIVRPNYGYVPFAPEVASRLRDAGLDELEAETLAQDLAAFVQPDGVGIGNFESYTSAAQIIDEALGGETETQYINDLLYTAIRASDEVFPVQAASVKVVPAAIPEGLFVLEDGGALITARGLAIHLVPASLDIVSFARRANSLGYAVRVMEDGGLVMTGNGTIISGTFSYTSVPTNEGFETGVTNRFVCTPHTCLASPTSENPASPDYYFTVGKWDRVQKLLPYFANDGLYDYLASEGYAVTTDRFETGFINIAGYGNFRPGYEIEGEALDESTYGTAELSLTETDANGDGVLDFRIQIGNTTQLLYGVP